MRTGSFRIGLQARLDLRLYRPASDLEDDFSLRPDRKPPQSGTATSGASYPTMSNGLRAPALAPALRDQSPRENPEQTWGFSLVGRARANYNPCRYANRVPAPLWTWEAGSRIWRTGNRYGPPASCFRSVPRHAGPFMSGEHLARILGGAFGPEQSRSVVRVVVLVLATWPGCS